MIIYNAPIGQPIKNPDDDFIKDIIFNKGEDYWKQGSGDSCIEVQGCDEWLIFFYDKPYGFFIMRHPDYLVIINDNIEIKAVEHIIEGEPMKVPTCSYVNRELTYSIIKEFIDKKEIPQFIEWIDLYEIDFEHGF